MSKYSNTTKFRGAPTLEKTAENYIDQTIESSINEFARICENFNITNQEQEKLDKALLKTIESNNPAIFECAVENYARQKDSSSETTERLDILTVFIRRLLTGPQTSEEESIGEEVSWRDFWRHHQACADGTIRQRE